MRAYETIFVSHKKSGVIIELTGKGNVIRNFIFSQHDNYNRSESGRGSIGIEKQNGSERRVLNNYIEFIEGQADIFPNP